MTNAPLLQLRDFKKKIIIQTNASGTSIGAVLTQNGHPVSFFSK